MSWEEELEEDDNNVQQEEKKDEAIPSIELESEEFIKTEVEKVKQNAPGTSQIDYEKKYLEMNKDSIKMRQEIEEAVKGIQDKDLRLKKMEELERNYMAGKFMGIEIDQGKVLELEKDFIRLAQKSAAKINEAKIEARKRPLFTYLYLENCLNDLLEVIPQEKINELLKATKAIINNKLKADNKKKESKKPSLAIKKITGRDDKIGKVYDDIAAEDEDYLDENYEDYI